MRSHFKQVENNSTYNISRFVKEFCHKKSTMPGKEKKGRDELIMKVVQYFTRVKLKSQILKYTHGVK